MSLSKILVEKFENKTASVGVVGLGYVGLPLVLALYRAGLRSIGFDVDTSKIESLQKGKSYIKTIKSSTVAKITESGLFEATGDFSRLKEVDALLLCVPTPLTKHREPDMSYVVATAESLVPHLRKGHIVILESTTYPGTTQELMVSILEKSGLKVDEDFYVAYSPEREDPGNPDFQTSTIPKVVGADSKEALSVAYALYTQMCPKVVKVSSSSTAEAVKLTENIFRSVNIALVNELKIIYDQMGIDVWEVIDAASTKPFGFMPFYPGPGLGGHCIPIDPFYLTWKAREYGISTRFIELAGEINTAMPTYVVRRLLQEMDMKFGRGLKNAKILVVGLAYKRNVDDARETPSFIMMDLLKAREADLSYYDPFIPEVPPSREHGQYTGMKSVSWSESELKGYDAAIICTDHDDVNYAPLLNSVPLVIDTRNALKEAKIPAFCHVVKA
ncbi:MAG: nucleotide sugar dehydrogenase [bacterium]|nr:nucleotide sugar dehydrogenase [bacterium]